MVLGSNECQGLPCNNALSGIMEVYFIRAGKRGAIKIGHARNVERRLEALQTGNAYRLEVIARIPCDSKQHAIEIEQQLHKHFRKQRIRREWFQGNIKFGDAIKHLNNMAARRTQTRKDKAKR